MVGSLVPATQVLVCCVQGINSVWTMSSSTAPVESRHDHKKPSACSCTVWLILVITALALLVTVLMIVYDCAHERIAITHELSRLQGDYNLDCAGREQQSQAVRDMCAGWRYEIQGYRQTNPWNIAIARTLDRWIAYGDGAASRMIREGYNMVVQLIMLVICLLVVVVVLFCMGGSAILNQLRHHGDILPSTVIPWPRHYERIQPPVYEITDVSETMSSMHSSHEGGGVYHRRSGGGGSQ